MISSKLRPFGTSIFSHINALASDRPDTFNLSQGAPDFEGPEALIEVAAEALRRGPNQYVRSMGHPTLVRAVADSVEHFYGRQVDPMTEVAITQGATEGLAAALLGLLEAGDEVILFEPFYDSYPALVRLAGAHARYLPLAFPDFELDLARLEALITPRTRLLVLNTPHNPTGKVFDRQELEALAELCQRHDLLVLSDEVYEHLTFDGAKHIPMHTLPGMWERTLTLSSAGKTFSFTGWKIGWAVGPAPLVAAAQAAHQFLTFCNSGAFQQAIAHGLEMLAQGDYLQQFQTDYAERRRVLVDGLQAAGFQVSPPAGTYFVCAGFDQLWRGGDDRAFAELLIANHGIAAIPTSAFHHSPKWETKDAETPSPEAHPEPVTKPLRFAFCKRVETLRAAAQRLAQLDLDGGAA